MTQHNKNILYTFLFAAAAMFIFSFSAVLGADLFEEWFGIIFGAAFMIAAIPVHNIAKRHTFLYFVSYLLNTIGCGFSVSAYYAVSGDDYNIGDFTAAILPAIALLLICAVVFVIVDRRNKRICFIFCVLDVILAAFAVYNWVKEASAFWTFMFFATTVALFYIIALRVVDNDEEFFGTKGSFVRTVSFFSFGIFIIVTLIVVAILSEGEIFDGFDIDIFGKDKKKQNIAAAAIAAETASDVGEAISNAKNKKDKDEK